MIRRINGIGVVIPVANEQRLLHGCLKAVHASIADLHRHRVLDVRVVVVLDSCTDASAAIAAGFGIDAIAVQGRCVGAARRAGARHLLRAAGRPSDEIWLANTDADSRVPADWLRGMLELAERDAALVLGTVRPVGPIASSVVDAWYATHVLDDGHPHVHGANFGIRGDAYLSLGGWPPLSTGEDEALAARAAARPDLHIERTSRFPVETSPRLTARAPRGFSSYLRGLSVVGLDGEIA